MDNREWILFERENGKIGVLPSGKTPKGKEICRVTGTQDEAIEAAENLERGEFVEQSLFSFGLR